MFIKFNIYSKVNQLHINQSIILTPDGHGRQLVSEAVRQMPHNGPGGTVNLYVIEY